MSKSRRQLLKSTTLAATVPTFLSNSCLKNEAKSGKIGLKDYSEMDAVLEIFTIRRSILTFWKNTKL